MKKNLFFVKCFLLGLAYAHQQRKSLEESIQEILAHYRAKIADAKRQLASIKARGFTVEGDRRRIKELEQTIASEQLLNQF